MAIRQRVGKHLKAQDWLSVLIDIAILVVGVFLGIQVALLRLQQVIAMSNRTVKTLNSSAFRLEAEFPDLIAVETRRDPNPLRPNEINSFPTCNTAGMLASQRFLNMAGSNIDLYDAFFRDAFEPWRRSISGVHGRVDQLLGITHAAHD